MALARLFGIPEAAWLTEAERAALEGLPPAPRPADPEVLGWRPLHTTANTN